MSVYNAGSFTMSRHGHTADIERLLDRGIPINVRDPYGSTLLVIACQNGSKRVAKLVLRRGKGVYYHRACCGIIMVD
jgi:ankyrin repeat protein